MATATGAQTTVNGSDRALRPRAPKPQHSQVSKAVSLVPKDAASSQPASLSDSEATSNPSSGRSTPIPVDAPPSEKSLVSARKQVRAQRRLFPTVEFASRVSHFDPNSDYRDFHGFFNLFWIGLAIMALTAMLRSLKETGYPLRVQIWGLFAVKLWHLAVADFLMVATTAPSLALQRMVRGASPASALTWARGGMAIQSIYEVLWMVVWVWIPFTLSWEWTAQVFFLLHTMVLLMKMHSYAFYNGHLSETEKRLRGLDNPANTDTSSPAYLYPAPAHPKETSDKTSKSPANSIAATKAGTSASKANGTLAPTADVRELREVLARELTSPMGNVTYPRNLNYANYLDYLLCPTLCYELEYPRTTSIDWQNLFSKIAATFGCIFLLTMLSEEFILPVLVESSARLQPTTPALEKLLILAETVSWLLFPFMLAFLLVFLVIFEYVLGAFAEITYFADRHFYSDWWNSTDWLEFSREWNVPVYSFLRRHVYSASLPHIGRPMATVCTFLISALGHEVVMGCITKKLRGYGFAAQMMQLPLMMIQRTHWVRGKKTLNNVFFWISMVLGLSAICSLYVLV